MSITLDVEPGHYYDLTLPAPDDTAVGARWVGGKPIGEGAPGAGPLEPMYRRRLIVKLDDFQTFSLERFQRFVGALLAHGGKADLGINPGKCAREVYAWLLDLDPERTEVWNHSWDHGAHGPLHRGLPLEVQLAHLSMVQEKVKEEVGLTPRAFGQPGIRYRDGWIGDQDEVTYLAVRAHPELVAIYDGGHTARQLGLQDELDPLFDPVSLTSIEWPPDDWVRGEPGQRYLVKYVASRYPQEDPNRPPAVGNAAEMQWRVDHPAADLADVDRQGAAYCQFHPWYWTKESDIEAVGEWAERISAQGAWRFSNCYEAFMWWRDRAYLALEKTAPNRYRLDARLLRFAHQMELSLPEGSRVDAGAYVVPLE